MIRASRTGTAPLRTTIGQIAADCGRLAALQWKLLAADAQHAKLQLGKVIIAAFLASFALLACVLCLCACAILVLHDRTPLSLAGASGIVAAACLAATAAFAALGWSALRHTINAFEATREELTVNRAFLRSMLSGDDGGSRVSTTFSQSDSH